MPRSQSLLQRLPQQEICFSSALDEGIHRCRKVFWLAPHVNGNAAKNAAANFHATRQVLIYIQRDDLQSLGRASPVTRHARRRADRYAWRVAREGSTPAARRPSRAT